MLESGFLVLESGFLVLESGFAALEPGFPVLDPEFVAAACFKASILVGRHTRVGVISTKEEGVQRGDDTMGESLRTWLRGNRVPSCSCIRQNSFNRSRRADGDSDKVDTT